MKNYEEAFASELTIQDKKNVNIQKVLSAAIFHNKRPEFVKFLLDRNDSMDFEVASSLPIIYPLQKADPGLLRSFIQKGAKTSINGTSKNYLLSLLMENMAVDDDERNQIKVDRHLHCASILLKEAHCMANPPLGQMSPLKKSIKLGLPHMTCLLLQHGADPLRVYNHTSALDLIYTIKNKKFLYRPGQIAAAHVIFDG